MTATTPYLHREQGSEQAARERRHKISEAFALLNIGESFADAAETAGLDVGELMALWKTRASAGTEINPLAHEAI